ncbi:MAG TPA: hypothetical protein VGM39_15690 [Kofleriaceae bacterium]|jgi:hypothetical protein
MPKRVRLKGTFVAYNLSPRGEHEGMMLETEDGLIQVNVPKHGEAPTATSGKEIELEATKHERRGKHPVYELAVGPDGITGTVVRYNYSRHGEVNGYHLESGEMVHVKPDGARKTKIAIGDSITVEGERRSGRDGHVIDAEGVKKVPRTAKRSSPES